MDRNSLDAMLEAKRVLLDLARFLNNVEQHACSAQPASNLSEMAEDIRNLANKYRHAEERNLIILN